MLSPGAFLKEYIRIKALKNPQFSMRSLARILGVSPPFLSRVLSDKSKLSMARAADIAAKIKLTKTEKQMFLRAVAVFSARGVAREVLMEALDELNHSPFVNYGKIASPVNNSLLREWYMPAILDLITCTNFKADASWISTKLKITRTEVVAALDELERMGLIDRSLPKWRKVEDALYSPTDEPSDVIRNYHIKMTQKVLELLNQKPSPSDFKKRSVTSMTMSADPEKLEQAKKMIEKFQDKLADTLTIGNCTDVYHLNVQLFPLTSSSS